MLGACCRGVSRRTVFAGLVAISASGLTARAQAKRRRFGVVVPNKQRHYYKRMLAGMSGAAVPLGVELHVEEYADDVKKQLLVVEALTQQGFDGYIIVSTQAYLAADIAGVLQKLRRPSRRWGSGFPAPRSQCCPTGGAPERSRLSSRRRSRRLGLLCSTSPPDGLRHRDVRGFPGRRQGEQLRRARSHNQQLLP